MEKECKLFIIDDELIDAKTDDGRVFFLTSKQVIPSTDCKTVELPVNVKDRYYINAYAIGERII